MLAWAVSRADVGQQLLPGVGKTYSCHGEEAHSCQAASGPIIFT